MQAVLYLPGVSDQTARRTEARLQVLCADDVIRRAAGSIEGMARVYVRANRRSAIDRRDRRVLRERRGVEVRMVEEVEEVQTELNRSLFVEERPALIHRHVRIIEVRSANDTSLSHVAGDLYGHSRPL